MTSPGWPVIVGGISVRLGDQIAYFDGLTFTRLDDETLRGYLAMHGSEGVAEEAFTYRIVRARSQEPAYPSAYGSVRIRTAQRRTRDEMPVGPLE